MSLTKIMLMSKEPQPDGSFRYYRIPWDIIRLGEFTGITPVSILSKFEAQTATTPYVSTIENDLLKLEAASPNEIADIEWFDSEQELMAIFDNVTMFYDTDSGQSAEAGYPRSV